MEDIVYKFIGEENKEKALEVMLRFVKSEGNQYSYQNCWLVEDDKKVIAAVNLYDGSQLTALRLPVVEYLRNRFNREFNFEDETQPGEYYIDSFGVSPDRQGKGVGTKLLQFVIDEYVNCRSQTLGLLVDEVNPKAKGLYVKLGFRTVAKRVLFGKSMEHLQITK